MTNAVITSQYASNNPTQRNRIINGAMVIDQRNAGASVTPTDGQYDVDRWCGRLTQASKFTLQQNAGSVTPPAGYKYYLGATVGASANVTVGAGDFFAIEQWIEGYNSADLGWGAAGAQTVTVSFWVRSSLTGTFGGSLRTYAGGYSYPFSYTISSANTWEQKTITITGATAGTWNTTNSGSIGVAFSLGAGSTYSGTAGAWAASTYFQPTGSVSVIANNSATFYITGVQLEAGTTATPFEYRQYGTELALCQRYYQDFRYNGTNGGGPLTNYMISDTTRVPLAPCLVTMRTSPTITPYTTGGVSGSLTQFSSAVNVVATANPLSNNYQGGTGYWQMASAVSNPVYQMNTYSAEL